MKFSAGQITSDGKILPTEKFLSEEGLAESDEVSVNDLLMVCIGGSIGKVAIVNIKAGYNQQINKIRPLLVYPMFLYRVISSPYFQQKVIEDQLNLVGSSYHQA